MRHHRIVSKGAAKRRRPSRKRRGLPPGPSGLDLPPPPRFPRLDRWLPPLVGAITLISMLAVAVLVAFAVRDEIRLDLHHEQAVARVRYVEEGICGPGSIRVEFVAGGRPVEATVARSWFGARPERGDQVRIEYLKSDPHVARRAGPTTPSRAQRGFAVVAILVIADIYLRPRPRRPWKARWGRLF
jgi:hypothetical protein